MSDIKEDGSELFHYDDPEFPIFCRHNTIPAGTNLHRYTPAHWHDEIELIYIVSGKIHHTVGDQYLTLYKGDGLFINARQIHELITDPEEDCILYCLIYDPTVLENCVRMEQLIRGVTTNADLPFIFLKESVPWQNHILQEIRSACENDKISNHDRHAFEIMISAYRILETLLENTDTVMPDLTKSNREQQLLKEMLHYIQRHYKDPLSLDEICRAGNIGKTKCTALFKKYLRITPMNYLRTFRIDRSIFLLRETDMSVADIAYEVGFEGASYYSEIFKKTLGLTPLAMRKSIGEESE